MSDCGRCATKSKLQGEILRLKKEIKTAAEGGLVAHVHRQRDFSLRTFGPGERTAGLIDHIRKELDEIERNPEDVTEWIDVVILALDGAWRVGHSPESIAAALKAKQEKNESRQWPDWRTAEPGKAIEHIREETGGPHG